jgi:hypothetical protein
MNPLFIAAIAAGIFAAGGWTGIEWHAGRDAIAAQKAEDARKTDALAQIRAADKAATSHAKDLATINRRLGDARAQIAKLSGRECFGADTTRVLNTIGTDNVPTTSSEPSDSPGTPAAGSGLRFTTDRDAAGHIALCRARYAEVSSQLNQILDIEEARQGATK